jgi:uncharacterized phage protein (TIGR02218 family)
MITTTYATAWSIHRSDGKTFGFTDHDNELIFNEMHFAPDTGMNALAIQQETGLSVDNTEAIGALRDDRISETDIRAGRYDNAEVRAYRVDWKNTDDHVLIFRGHIGEITIKGGAFQAEIRGLSAFLNRPFGSVFQTPCSAVLGDKRCQFDTSMAGFQHETTVAQIIAPNVLGLDAMEGFDPTWFTRGKIEILSGAAKGLIGAIKSDDQHGATRQITLWTALGLQPESGDRVRITTGCDKQFATCRDKFSNILNYRGFPDIPPSDWVMVHPTHAMQKAGGSRR